MNVMKQIMLAALATMVAGCGDDVSGPDIPPPLDVVVVDGVRFQASTRFSDDQPDRLLVVSITATNERANSVDVRFGGACPELGILVHDNPNREGDPVWGNIAPTPPTDVCQLVPLNDFTLLPGTSHEVQRGLLIDEILNGGRSSGRFYFTVVLPLATGPIAVKAGDLELTG